jgi:hypothetical protein
MVSMLLERYEPRSPAFNFSAAIIRNFRNSSGYRKEQGQTCLRTDGRDRHSRQTCSCSALRVRKHEWSTKRSSSTNWRHEGHPVHRRIGCRMGDPRWFGERGLRRSNDAAGSRCGLRSRSYIRQRFHGGTHSVQLIGLRALFDAESSTWPSSRRRFCVDC